MYTIYYSWWTSSTSSWNNSWFSVETFNTDAALYQFTSPSTNGYYSTNEDFVTIRWLVKDENVVSIEVNGFKLSSYDGSTWRYHAATQNNNLYSWTNQYEVKYFDANGKLIYKNYFTIVKNEPSAINTNKIISNEVTTTDG